MYLLEYNDIPETVCEVLPLLEKTHIHACMHAHTETEELSLN